MTLHTVSSSPFTSRALENCRTAASPGDTLLLYADGVYAALRQAVLTGALQQLLETITVYAIEEDCVARGITEHLFEEIRLCDYHFFVALAASHDKSIAWF